MKNKILKISINKLCKVIILIIFIQSCSLYTLNRNISSNYTIRKGSFNGKFWDDGLVFKRYSWIDQLSINLDLLFTSIEQKDNFYNWLSFEEQKSIENCNKFIVVISYFKDRTNYGITDLKSDLRESNYRPVIISHFARNLIAHPQVVYNDNLFNNYKINGFCREEENFTGTNSSNHKEPNYKEVKIKVPGNPVVKIDLN
jgi:hypothetical protein